MYIIYKFDIFIKFNFSKLTVPYIFETKNHMFFIFIVYIYNLRVYIFPGLVIRDSIEPNSQFI